MNERRFQKRTIFLIAYLIFALLPVYWMVNMSFKTNEEILASFSLWPRIHAGPVTAPSSPMRAGTRATSTA
jgi:ABC-type glycerol-3-phosphate transport system permease component